MNGQNNYNFQNNSFNNSNNNPMHPVKNRFFNQELFNDANLSDVGTSTTEQASNYSLDNFVMGSDFTNNSVNVNNNNRVSGASNNDVPVEAPKQNQFSSIFSQDLLEDVNASVYPPNTVELTQSNKVNDTLDSYSEAEVLDTYIRVCKEYIGNPNSLHELGISSKRLIDASTSQVASILGIKEKACLHLADRLFFMEIA